MPSLDERAAGSSVAARKPADRDRDTVILGAEAVARQLAGQERQILALVRETLLAHERGETCALESAFLRFPGDRANRIIAKPARIDGPAAVAGVKWVSSFPGNLARRLDRCSSVLILNCVETGRPTAILEGTLINFQRTAACAALAAEVLPRARKRGTTGLVGCGNINFEQIRFLLTLFPDDREFRAFDRDPARAVTFVERCRREYGIAVAVADRLEELLAACDLISFATTASDPHLHSLAACAPGTLLLHTSLRDVGVDALLASDNVVDDVAHVCSANTSVHLAEQRVGHRRFIRATLGAVLAGDAPPKPQAGTPTVFSPFGLAVLDLAVGRFVLDEAIRSGGSSISIRFMSAAGTAHAGLPQAL